MTLYTGFTISSITDQLGNKIALVAKSPLLQSLVNALFETLWLTYGELMYGPTWVPLAWRRRHSRVRTTRTHKSVHSNTHSQRFRSRSYGVNYLLRGVEATGIMPFCSLDPRYTLHFYSFRLQYIVLRDYQMERVGASNPNASSSTRRLSVDSVPAPRPVPHMYFPFSCSLHGLESLSSQSSFLRILRICTSF